MPQQQGENVRALKYTVGTAAKSRAQERLPAEETGMPWTERPRRNVFNNETKGAKKNKSYMLRPNQEMENISCALQHKQDVYNTCVTDKQGKENQGVRSPNGHTVVRQFGGLREEQARKW